MVDETVKRLADAYYDAAAGCADLTVGTDEYLAARLKAIGAREAYDNHMDARTRAYAPIGRK